MNKYSQVLRIFYAWSRAPELRLSQVIWNTFRGEDFFYMPDEEFVKRIEDHVHDLNKKELAWKLEREQKALERHECESIDNEHRDSNKT